MFSSYAPSVTTIFQSNFGGADIFDEENRRLLDQMPSLNPPRIDEGKFSELNLSSVT